MELINFIRHQSIIFKNKKKFQILTKNRAQKWHHLELWTKELGDTVKTAYGPYGMNKIVQNHIEKIFLTSDAATMIRELDIKHPAAKMVVMAAHQQEEEAG